jgi:phage-related protein
VATIRSYSYLYEYTGKCIFISVKGIEFLGSSLQMVREFPALAKREVGHQLDRIQHGLDPTDWKPVKSIGRGVREIRIQHEGLYRVIYVASFEEIIYVLHAFQKKSRKTNRQDLDTAKRALQEVLERHRS